MKRGYGVGDRYSQDPVGSDAPRGKDTSRRKHRNDPGWTPTEQHQRNEMMRQFMRNPEGEPNGSAYREASCWCECGRGLKQQPSGVCLRCASAATKSFYDAHTAALVREVEEFLSTDPRPTPNERGPRLLGPDATTPHPDHGNP